MAFIDYYKILGVDKTIPQKDVKRAYLKRAKQFHPDLHPDDPKAKAKFQALTEAYDVIGDPEKRAKYDKYGEQWKQAEAYEKAGGGFGGYGGAQGNPFEGFDFSSFGGGGGGFSSFFQDLFGGGMRGGQGFGAHTTYKEQPKNTQATVTIDMYTALLGGDIMVTTGTGERRPHPDLSGEVADRTDRTTETAVATDAARLIEMQNAGRLTLHLCF